MLTKRMISRLSTANVNISLAGSCVQNGVDSENNSKKEELALKITCTKFVCTSLGRRRPPKTNSCTSLRTTREVHLYFLPFRQGASARSIGFAVFAGLDSSPSPAQEAGFPAGATGKIKGARNIPGGPGNLPGSAASLPGGPCNFPEGTSDFSGVTAKFPGGARNFLGGPRKFPGGPAS